MHGSVPQADGSRERRLGLRRAELPTPFFADLHTHSSASFDSLASPASLVRTAASRGLTHLAITDHDRIDGALAARDVAATLAPALSVIVGEEVKTTEGDLIALFLERAVRPGLRAEDAIAEVRAQGGLVGIPHPFDRFRGSLLRNIDKLLTQVTGVPCHVAENSLNCVALGTGLALEHFDFFKKSLVSQI